MSEGNSLRPDAYYAKRGQRGVSVMEILFVFVVLAVVTSFALVGIRQIRSSFQLTNNADILKGNLEKAFTDARRRHAQGAARCRIQVTSATSYDFTGDFNDDGAVETKTVTLTNNTRFVYDPAAPPTATVDWRGNIAEGAVHFVINSTRTNQTMTLSLTSKGDVSDDGSSPAMPVITATTTSADVKMTAVANGNTAPDPNPSPTAVPTPLPLCTGTQQPFVTPCRCAAGHTIDPKNGRCK